MLNVDATLIRILLVVATIISSGTVILIYIIASLVVPKEPNFYSGYGPNNFGNGGYGSDYNNQYGSYSNHNNTYGNANQNQWGNYRSQPGPEPGPRPTYGPGPVPGAGPGPTNNPGPGPSTNTQFDSMMDDLEKKALRREIEELKNKMKKYEKGEF